MSRLVLALAALLLALPATAQTPGDPYANVVARAVERYILPAYNHLRLAAEELATATDAYCKDPGGRAAVEAAFRLVHERWAGVDFLRFGPMADRGRFERFYFWPDPRGIGERQLRQILAARDPALLDPAVLAENSAAVQGMAALERLLYDGERLLERPGDDGRYRCGLAVAITQNLAAIAAEVDDGWRQPGGWAALMLDPGGDPPVYLDAREAANELLKALLTGLEQLKDQRIGIPLGASAEEARPARAPFSRSDLTFDYWRHTVAALADFAATADFASLATGADAAWIGPSAVFETRQVERALGELGPSLEAALTEPEGRERLAYVITALGSIRVTYGTELAAAAGLAPGFNALDGD